MSLNVTEFKGAFDGGARPNQFRVTFNGAFGTDDNQVSFLAKGASLPGSTVNAIDVPFRGRVIKVSGDRPAAEDWTVTFINNNDFAIFKTLNAWMHTNLNKHSENTMPDSNPEAYKTDLSVEQLSKTEETITTYKIIGAFPTVISPIELSYDTTDSVEEFTVTFSYDYWTNDDFGVQ